MNLLRNLANDLADHLNATDTDLSPDWYNEALFTSTEALVAPLHKVAWTPANSFRPDTSSLSSGDWYYRAIVEVGVLPVFHGPLTSTLNKLNQRPAFVLCKAEDVFTVEQDSSNCWGAAPVQDDLVAIYVTARNVTDGGSLPEGYLLALEEALGRTPTTVEQRIFSELCDEFVEFTLSF